MPAHPIIYAMVYFIFYLFPLFFYHISSAHVVILDQTYGLFYQICCLLLPIVFTYLALKKFASPQQKLSLQSFVLHIIKVFAILVSWAIVFTLLQFWFDQPHLIVHAPKNIVQILLSLVLLLAIGYSEEGFFRIVPTLWHARFVPWLVAVCFALPHITQGLLATGLAFVVAISLSLYKKTYLHHVSQSWHILAISHALYDGAVLCLYVAK